MGSGRLRVEGSMSGIALVTLGRIMGVVAASGRKRLMDGHSYD